jgi:hypothetical protein
MIYMFAERSAEWLKFRTGYLSATEIGSLVGVNSYMTANQLKKQKENPNGEPLDNKHIRDGLISEAAVFSALKLLGWSLGKLAPDGFSLVFTDEEHKLSSTPDNFRWDGQPAVVEVKKTTKDNFVKNWMGSTPPLRYLAQVQAQMHTTGMRKGFLCCIALEDNIPLSVYEIQYSEAFMELVIEAAVRFRDPTAKKLIIKDEIRQQAVDYLERSFQFEGIYRHGSEDVIDLAEIFK